MAVIITILSITAGLLTVVAAAEATCYTPRERNGQCRRDPYRLPSTLFGTKTTYRHATGLHTKWANRARVPGCKPLLLMIFMRHTTRFPGKKDLEKFAVRLPELQSMILNASRAGSGTLCREHVTSLRKWKYNWDESLENRVTSSGIRETGEIASRFRRMFPGLLPGRFYQDEYIVRATSKNRTQDTAYAFLKAVLYRKELKKFKRERALAVDDDLLAFQSRCEDMLEKQGVNKTESQEENKFLDSTEVQQMVEAMSKRLGVNVTTEDVRLMAKICAFEVAVRGWSPFCYLFDKADLDLLEYAKDLDDYEEDAYGNQRSVALGCLLVEEMVDKIREKLRTSLTGGASFHTHLRAALYFTHAAVMKSLVAKLGLGRAAPPLSASNYCRYRHHRPWRSSHLVPFTANFALVLFQCGNSLLNVLPILNEKVVWLPGCRREFCPLEDFLRSSVVHSSRNCDPEKICSKSWNGSGRAE
ncbi:multiple inositol polyphosphate phosphatase 1 [Rhipicephalus sanguineus]|uniref:multiple inositol polyphosphate phosphatase 1 n=1 Tax=Rhipicephalus sanguineus TaxID=34632 RepID=UPI0018939A41|nr:multiple inositol polyphosphate phosphatase 1 [Rhipicephalus sanguineus]